MASVATPSGATRARAFAAVFIAAHAPLHGAFTRTWAAHDTGSPEVDKLRITCVGSGAYETLVYLAPVVALDSRLAALSGAGLALQSFRDEDAEWAWSQLRARGVPLPESGHSYVVRTGSNDGSMWRVASPAATFRWIGHARVPRAEIFSCWIGGIANGAAANRGGAADRAAAADCAADRGGAADRAGAPPHRV